MTAYVRGPSLSSPLLSSPLLSSPLRSAPLRSSPLLSSPPLLSPFLPAPGVLPCPVGHVWSGTVITYISSMKNMCTATKRASRHVAIRSEVEYVRPCCYGLAVATGARFRRRYAHKNILICQSIEGQRK
jgi:hypothetical protein